MAAIRQLREQAGRLRQRLGTAARSDGADRRLAQGLGWFSIALGLAEVGAARRLARAIGVGDTVATRSVLRAFGMREIATGIGILTRPASPGFIEARVGGDLVDLAFLGTALAAADTRRKRVAAATGAVLGVTALDLMATERLRRKTAAATGQAPIRGTITINLEPAKVYGFWRRLENVPTFMRFVESVRVIDDRTSHWIASTPVGGSVEWDAEITEDQPDRRIAWRARSGTPLFHGGTVRFERAPGGRGTEVHVEIDYKAPANALVAGAAKLVGHDPAGQLRQDLRILKQLLETGEVVTARGPTARRTRSLFGRGPEVRRAAR